MTWHKKGRRFEDEKGRLKMGHPSDGEAWKNFDKKYKRRAEEARNVRIAIATDGFNPYGMSAANYSRKIGWTSRSGDLFIFKL